MDEDRRCPLHWGAYKGFKDVVKLLFWRLTADVMRPDREGCTALHWAAIRGKAEAAHVLALCGGEELLKARDTDGNTPSQLAHGERSQEFIEHVDQSVGDSSKKARRGGRKKAWRYSV